MVDFLLHLCCCHWSCLEVSELVTAFFPGVVLTAGYLYVLQCCCFWAAEFKMLSSIRAPSFSLRPCGRLCQQMNCLTSSQQYCFGTAGYLPRGAVFIFPGPEGWSARVGVCSSKKMERWEVYPESLSTVYALFISGESNKSRPARLSCTASLLTSLWPLSVHGKSGKFISNCFCKKYGCWWRLRQQIVLILTSTICALRK